MTLPTYDCHLAAAPPVLDGVLEDPCWEGIPEIVLRDYLTGAPTVQATTVQLVWHGDYLYAAWRVTEFDVREINEHRNDPVFRDQCVEHFLQAPAGLPASPGEPHRYAEMDISPTGVIWDGLIVNPRPFPRPAEPGPGITVDESWDPEDLLVASRIEGTLNDSSDRDTGWTLEIQIPLHGPPGGCTPQIGEVWRLNLYRIHGWESPDRELQSWSTVGIGDFHVPQRFGYLRFAGPLA